MKVQNLNSRPPILRFSVLTVRDRNPFIFILYVMPSRKKVDIAPCKTRFFLLSFGCHKSSLLGCPFDPAAPVC